MIPISQQRDIVYEFVAERKRFTYKDLRQLQSESGFPVRQHIDYLVARGKLTQEDRELPNGDIETTFIFKPRF